MRADQVVRERFTNLLFVVVMLTVLGVVTGAVEVLEAWLP
jgi:hypothetical protein